MAKKNSAWKRLFRLMPKKKIYIEGNASEQQPEQELEVIEGEAGPVRVYFDKDCEYEIIEREISPAKLPCPGCKKMISYGMDYCNICGYHVTEKME